MGDFAVCSFVNLFIYCLELIPCKTILLCHMILVGASVADSFSQLAALPMLAKRLLGAGHGSKCLSQLLMQQDDEIGTIYCLHFPDEEIEA